MFSLNLWYQHLSKNSSVFPQRIVQARHKKNRKFYSKENIDLSRIFKTKKIALSKVNEKEFILFFSEREGLKLTHLWVQSHEQIGEIVIDPVYIL